MDLNDKTRCWNQAAACRGGSTLDQLMKRASPPKTIRVKCYDVSWPYISSPSELPALPGKRGDAVGYPTYGADRAGE